MLRIHAREPPVPVRPPSFKVSCEIGLRSLKRGNEAEDDAGQQRNAERERESAPINPDLVNARDLNLVDFDQRADPEPCQRQSESAANHREQRAFGQQLSNDAAPSGAKRRSDRHLFLPVGRPRQQQVGDVRAGDQQNEADDSHQYPQRLANVADHEFIKRLRGQSPVAAIRAGHILLSQIGGYGVQLGLRLPDLDAGLESRDYEEVFVGQTVIVQLFAGERDRRPQINDPPELAPELKARRDMTPTTV